MQRSGTEDHWWRNQYDNMKNSRNDWRGPSRGGQRGEANWSGRRASGYATPPARPRAAEYDAELYRRAHESTAQPSLERSAREPATERSSREPALESPTRAQSSTASQAAPEKHKKNKSSSLFEEMANMCPPPREPIPAASLTASCHLTVSIEADLEEVSLYCSASVVLAQPGSLRGMALSESIPVAEYNPLDVTVEEAIISRAAGLGHASQPGLALVPGHGALASSDAEGLAVKTSPPGLSEVHRILKTQQITGCRMESVSEGDNPRFSMTPECDGLGRKNGPMYIQRCPRNLGQCLEASEIIYDGENGTISELRIDDDPAGPVYAVSGMFGYPEFSQDSEDALLDCDILKSMSLPDLLCSVSGLNTLMGEYREALTDGLLRCPSPGQFLRAPTWAQGSQASSSRQSTAFDVYSEYVPLLRKCRVQPSLSILKRVRDQGLMMRLAENITLIARDRRYDKRGKSRDCDPSHQPEKAMPNTCPMARVIQDPAWGEGETVEIVTPPTAIFGIDEAFMYISSADFLQRRKVDIPIASGIPPHASCAEHWSMFMEEVVEDALQSYGKTGAYEMFVSILSHVEIPKWYSGAYYLGLSCLLPMSGKRVLLMESGLGEGILPILSTRPSRLAACHPCGNGISAVEKLVEFGRSGRKSNITLSASIPLGEKFDVVIAHPPTFAGEWYSSPEIFTTTDYGKWKREVLLKMLAEAKGVMEKGGYLSVTATDTYIPTVDGKPVPIMPECMRLRRTRAKGVMTEKCRGHVDGSTHSYSYPSDSGSLARMDCPIVRDTTDILRSLGMSHVLTVMSREGMNPDIRKEAVDVGGMTAFQTMIWRLG